MSEFKELFTDKAKVERFVEDTESTRPMPEKTKITISESIDCSIQSRRTNPFIIGSAKDNVKYKNMYCDDTDLQEGDIVTNLANNSTFSVTEVNSVEGVLIIKLQSYKE